MGEEKKLQIRNSTVDFLVFTRDAGESGIEVRVQDGNVWLTQKGIGQLFDVDRSVVTKHLKKIFADGELDENSACAFFAQVADNGKTYRYKFYSLPAIIAVGYRVNSQRATQFRQWATNVLETFTKQGYVLDKSRLINGQIFDQDYFEQVFFFFIIILPRSTQQQLTTLWTARSQRTFLPPSRTKCTMRPTAVRQRRSSWTAPTIPSRTWA